MKFRGNFLIGLGVILIFLGLNMPFIWNILFTEKTICRFSIHPPDKKLLAQKVECFIPKGKYIVKIYGHQKFHYVKAWISIEAVSDNQTLFDAVLETRALDPKKIYHRVEGVSLLIPFEVKNDIKNFTIKIKSLSCCLSDYLRSITVEIASTALNPRIFLLGIPLGLILIFIGFLTKED